MKISVILEALTGSFETDIKRAAKESKKAFAQMKSDAKTAGVVIGASLVAATAAVGYAVKSAIDEMDQISKGAQKIGTTTEALSALQYAAGLADVSTGQLQGAMTRLVRAQAEVARGTARQSDLFAALGIEAVNADGTLRNTADVMADVADRFAAMEDGADKTAVAVELFGRAGADIIPLLNGGAAGLRSAADEAERFGLIVSEEAGRAAEEFNDDLTRMGAAVEGASRQLAMQLLPTLEDLSAQVVTMASDAAFRDGLAAAIRGIGNAVVFTANAIAQSAGMFRWLAESVAAAVHGPVVGDMPRIDDAIAEAERKLKRFDEMRKASGVSGSTGEEEAAVRADLERLRQMRDVTLELAAAQQQVQPLAEIVAPKTAPTLGRLFAPSSGGASQSKSSGPAEKSTWERDSLLDQAAEGMREIEDRYREHQSVLADLDRLRFDAMTREQQQVVTLQGKYLELQNAVAAGVIEQEEASRIAAGLAERWAENVKTETEEMSEFAKAAAQNMQQAFADFLFDPFSGSLREMALDFVNVLRRMAAEAIAAQIFDKIAGGGKDGKAGFFASFLGMFAGAKDAGGSIPSGKFALVGERRPELVAGPATVMGGAQTAGLMRSGGSAATKIRLISITDAQNFHDYLGSDPAEQTLIAFAERNQGFFRQLVAS